MIRNILATALMVASFGTISTLSGCVAFEEPSRHDGYRGDRDHDRDGMRNRGDRDRDGDGVRNRDDRRPDDPRRN